MEQEVKRLRSLLARYVNHVGAWEGVDFLTLPHNIRARYDPDPSTLVSEPLTDLEQEEIYAISYGKTLQQG